MQLLESGLKQCEVAKKLGLTKQRISQIANKKKAGHSAQGGATL
jgi:transcriptional regulator with XRE-family HTH domain